MQSKVMSYEDMSRTQATADDTVEQAVVQERSKKWQTKRKIGMHCGPLFVTSKLGLTLI